MYNLYDEDEDSSLEDRSSENAVMKDKVRNLKAKMRVINASKKVIKTSDIMKFGFVLRNTKSAFRDEDWSAVWDGGREWESHCEMYETWETRG